MGKKAKAKKLYKLLMLRVINAEKKGIRKDSNILKEGNK